MLNISNLSVHFTGEYLFKDVQFIVADNDKIGLVGKNGVGKTTLLRILAKELVPQSGTIVITEGHKIGYLPQEMKLESHETVFNEVINAIVEKKQLDAEISALQSAIENETDFKSKANTFNVGVPGSNPGGFTTYSSLFDCCFFVFRV